jgi:phthiodiolone/phenolphthiodiolone dimycocerosates ketoreductase
VSVEVDIAGPAATPLRGIAEASEAVAATEAGLWWPDHLIGWFPRGLWHPDYGVDPDAPHPDNLADPFIAAAAAAMAGRPRRVGLVVTDPVRRHPASLLQSAATVASAAPEFVLGLGAGAAANLDPFGFDVRRRFRRLRDALDVLGALQAGDDPVWHESESFRLTGAVSGIPERRRVRTWIGGVTERYATLAGASADGFVPTRMPEDRYEQLVTLMRETAHAAGRPQPVASMFVWALVCETGGEARRLLRGAPFLRSLMFFRGADYYEARGLRHPMDGITPDLHYLPATLSRPDGETALSRVPAEAVEDYVLHGSVADVEAWLAVAERRGLEHVVLFDLAPYVKGARDASRMLELVIRRSGHDKTAPIGPGRANDERT